MSLWRELSAAQQRIAAVASALLLTLFLPWYRSSFTVGAPPRIVRDNLTAFEVFTFVEAAILLVAAAIMYLLYARAQRRGFHLPGGDGWAVTAGGAWVIFLLVWRLFDKPDVEQGAVGVQWGLFAAMGVGAALVAAGQRLRAEHRPEPPNPAAEDPAWEEPRRRRARHPERRPVDSEALTEVLRERRPTWEGEPPEPPSPIPPPTRRLDEALERDDRDDPPPAGDDPPPQPRLF